MSRPEPPRSSLDHGRSEVVDIFVKFPLALVGAWELVWLVMLLSGNSPEGQIWDVLGRWVAMASRAAVLRPTAGGWLWASWGLTRPISWVPVVLVGVGLVVGAVVVMHFVEHGLPTRRPRGDRSRGASRASATSPPKETVSGQRNTKLRDWLDDQADGKD